MNASIDEKRVCQLNCGRPWTDIIPVCDLTQELRDMVKPSSLIAVCSSCRKLCLRNGGQILGYRHRNGRTIQYVKEELI